MAPQSLLFRRYFHPKSTVPGIRTRTRGSLSIYKKPLFFAGHVSISNFRFGRSEKGTLACSKRPYYGGWTELWRPQGWLRSGVKGS